MTDFQSWAPLQSPLRPIPALTTLSTPLMPRSPNAQTLSGLQIPDKIFNIPLSPPLTPKPTSPRETRAEYSSKQRTTSQPSSTAAFRQRGRQNPNPLTQSTEVQTRRRRDKYLNRIHGDREQARWNIRSDQILHQDFLTQHRTWEMEQARLASEYETDDFAIYEDDNTDQEQISNPMNDDTAQDASNVSMNDAEIEDILALEAQELDALVSMHQEPAHMSASDDYAFCSSPGYGSEDAEFENMLYALSQPDGTNDDMDIS